MSVTRAVVRFLLLSIAAGIVFIAAGRGRGDDNVVSLGAYLAAVATLAAIEALRWMRLATGADAATVPSLVRRGVPAPSPRPAALLGLEALVDSACLNGRAARVRLQPRLQELARHRLAAAHGIDLAGDPDAAARVLGATAWGVLAPPRGPVPDPDDPGLPLADILATVEALERL